MCINTFLLNRIYIRTYVSSSGSCERNREKYIHLPIEFTGQCYKFKARNIVEIYFASRNNTLEFRLIASSKCTEPWSNFVSREKKKFLLLFDFRLFGLRTPEIYSWAHHHSKTPLQAAIYHKFKKHNSFACNRAARTCIYLVICTFTKQIKATKNPIIQASNIIYIQNTMNNTTILNTFTLTYLKYKQSYISS